MGTEIAKIILDDSSVQLSTCIEYKGHPRIGEDYGECIGVKPLGISLTDTAETIDQSSVIIDFSSPGSTRALLEKAATTSLRIVIGTTGLQDSDHELAKRAASTSPILVSPNMSVGVNLLFALTKLVSTRLKESFDIEIIEAHHRHKKDAPSGTAKKLGELVAEAIGYPYNSVVKNGREGMSQTDRSRQEVGIHAVRGGDIVGDHTVLFAGQGERIELRHMAHSRSTFAQGAVTAAKWLASQGPGLYSMHDVLGL